MRFFLILIFISFVFSCTRLQTINLKPHYYSERPTHIIWIQIAGFADQHLPLLRFSNPNVEYKTQLETSDCVGKMWNFNLYDLRPQASTSFISQIVGSQNIKKTCEDFSKRPIWSYLADEGYKASILENGASEVETLEKFITCNDIKNSEMKNVELVRMGPESKSGINSFHFQEHKVSSAGLYYDKSCQKEICYSAFSDNAKKIISTIGLGNTKNFYLLRDFNYLKALKKKDVSRAKEILQDIDKLLFWIDSQKRNDVLIVVSGAEGIELDFPKEGKEWAEFEKTGKFFNVKNATLMSSVFAKGPMAENFCGIFNETELTKRLLIKPQGRKFSWDAINPLKF